MQETVKTVGSLRFCGSESVETSKRDIVMDEKIYVAVTGRDLENKSSLVWAIQNSGGREFCIVYVHQPIQKLRLHRKEKERAHKSLDKYLNICRQMQVSAEKLFIEMDSVEEGILHLISNQGVKKLVMGAAADKHYSMRMKDLQSKKTIYIHREASSTCHIWFTCKGYLICSREGRKRDDLYLECASSNSSSQSEITKGTESVPSSSMVKDDDQIAIKRAKQSENVYISELKRRKETEKALRQTKEELEKMIRKLQYKYSLSMEALRRLRQEQEELKIELREVSKLKGNRENHGPPQYFICPITQDVMEDPHVAADGFTYEGEAISNWFERGHETSPMTNKRLTHTSLVPNLALRSAIQEWLIKETQLSPMTNIL
ncbi:hypothetical protein N665_4635s0003 [Sinapis alba]|nr:hypothetical protein N665_4635s0003 [Sinapis alba]